MPIISSGVISALLGILSMTAGVMGKGQLAAWLKDPATVQNILVLVGALFSLAAGFLPGPAHVAKDVPVNLPGTAPTEYPGWKWDPLQGWVRDESAGKS